MIVCLDTNIVIYLVEANPSWTPKAAARLGVLRAAGDDIAVCDAARLECLVQPRVTGNTVAETAYQAFFSSPAVRMLPVTPSTWDHAARIAAAFRLKGLDSVHLAAAVENGCRLFLTSDAQLARCTVLPIEVLT